MCVWWSSGGGRRRVRLVAVGDAVIRMMWDALLEKVRTRLLGRRCLVRRWLCGLRWLRRLVWGRLGWPALAWASPRGEAASGYL